MPEAGPLAPDWGFVAVALDNPIFIVSAPKLQEGLAQRVKPWADVQSRLKYSLTSCLRAFRASNLVPGWTAWRPHTLANSGLWQKKIAPAAWWRRPRHLLKRAQAANHATGEKQRLFTSFSYRAESWTRTPPDHYQGGIYSTWLPISVL